MIKKGLMRCVLIALFTMLWLPMGFAQNLQEWYQQSKQAYANEAYGDFLTATLAADSLRPNHPILTYNLAAAYSLNGLYKKSADALLHRMTFYADSAFMTDPDFEGLRSSFHYGRVKRKLPQYLKTVSYGSKAFEISNFNIHPEGILWSNHMNQFIISDIYQGLLLKVSEGHNKIKPWLSLADWGYWSAMGMIEDPDDSSTIWVVSSALPQFIDYSDEEDGKAALLKIDLDSGELIDQYTIDGTHVFGDLTAAPDGSIYVSDSRDPKIYRLDPSSNQLEEYITDDRWLNLQGMAISVDGRKLWVSDYILGLFEINLLTKQVTPFYYENSLLRGTDGLYRIGNNLALIQNGTLPKRITKVNIDYPENQPVIIESGILQNQEPTLGTVKHGELYYLADSPWGLYDEQNRPKLKQWPNIVVRVIDFN